MTNFNLIVGLSCLALLALLFIIACIKRLRQQCLNKDLSNVLYEKDEMWTNCFPCFVQKGSAISLAEIDDDFVVEKNMVKKIAWMGDTGQKIEDLTINMSHEKRDRSRSNSPTSPIEEQEYEIRTTDFREPSDYDRRIIDLIKTTESPGTRDRNSFINPNNTQVTLPLHTAVYHHHRPEIHKCRRDIFGDGHYIHQPEEVKPLTKENLDEINKRQGINSQMIDAFNPVFKNAIDKEIPKSLRSYLPPLARQASPGNRFNKRNRPKRCDSQSVPDVQKDEIIEETVNLRRHSSSKKPTLNKLGDLPSSFDLSSLPGGGVKPKIIAGETSCSSSESTATFVTKSYKKQLTHSSVLPDLKEEKPFTITIQTFGNDVSNAKVSVAPPNPRLSPTRKDKEIIGKKSLETHSDSRGFHTTISPNSDMRSASVKKRKSVLYRLHRRGHSNHDEIATEEIDFHQVDQSNLHIMKQLDTLNQIEENQNREMSNSSPDYLAQKNKPVDIVEAVHSSSYTTTTSDSTYQQGPQMDSTGKPLNWKIVIKHNPDENK